MENNQFITVSRHPVRDVILVETRLSHHIQHPVRDATSKSQVASLTGCRSIGVGVIFYQYFVPIRDSADKSIMMYIVICCLFRVP